ncbi:MAG: hypothetical protein ACM3QU_04575 [Verrucomicrobiota bacterium]
MGVWQRVSSWWNRDANEAAAEAVRDDAQARRDRAGEDFEGSLDDVQARSDTLAGGAADFERDSEPPRSRRPS